MFKFIQKRKLSPGVKASIGYTLGYIFQKGIAFITVPIFTRLLTTGEYGEYSVYQSWYAILSIFATLNLSQDCFNRGMVKYTNRDSFTSSMQGLSTTVTFILFGIFIAFHSTFKKALDLPYVIIIAMFIEFIFEAAYSLWKSRMRFEYRYKEYLIVSMSAAVISPVLGIIWVTLTKNYKAEARVLSFIIVECVIGAVLYVINLKKGKIFYNKEHWKFALQFSLPLIPHFLSQIILVQADRLMINYMVGRDKAAIYSVAYSVATIMFTINSAILFSYTPYLYTKMKNKSMQGVKRTTNAILVLLGGMILGAICFGPEVMKIVATSEYYEAIWIIPPVSLSVFFTFVYTLFTNIEFYYEETRYALIVSACGAVLNVVLNYICIKRFGYIAAGYTTIVCYILFAIAHYFFMKKVQKKHNVAEIYDEKFILLISVVLIIGMILMLFLYNLTIVRWIFILCLAIIAFKFRNKIRSIFTLMKEK
jgi:O-antigen/teichoic acid export membrane protein